MLLGAYEKYEEELTHEFAMAAFVLNPAFAAEAKALMQHETRLAEALEVIAGRVLVGLNEDERLPAVASVVEAVLDM